LKGSKTVTRDKQFALGMAIRDIGDRLKLKGILLIAFEKDEHTILQTSGEPGSELEMQAFACQVQNLFSDGVINIPDCLK
jgi:hypothetical protein